MKIWKELTDTKRSSLVRLKRSGDSMNKPGRQTRAPYSPRNVLLKGKWKKTQTGLKPLKICTYSHLQWRLHCGFSFSIWPLHCRGVTWKRPMKVQNLKPLCPFVFFFSLACERIFIKTHGIESRYAMGLENILCVGASMRLSARNFYRLRQWSG